MARIGRHFSFPILRKVHTGFTRPPSCVGSVQLLIAHCTLFLDGRNMAFFYELNIVSCILEDPFLPNIIAVFGQCVAYIGPDTAAGLWEAVTF